MKCDLCGKDHGEGLNDIGDEERYIHCRMCLEEIPGYMSASEYSRLEVVITHSTLRVNCMRHKLPVLGVAFDPNVEFTAE